VNAISDAVAHALEICQDSIWKDKGASTKDAISAAAAMVKSSVEGKSGGTKGKVKPATAAELLANMPVGNSDDDSAAEPPSAAKRGRAGAAKKAAPTKTAAKKPAAKSKRSLSPDDVESIADSNVSDMIEDSDDDVALRAKTAATKAKSASVVRPARTNAKKSYVDGDDEDGEEATGYDDEEDAFDVDDSDEEKPKRGRKKATAAKKPAAKKTAAAKKPAAAKHGTTSKKVATEVMDLISDDDYDQEPSKPSASSKRQPNTSVSQVLLTAGYTPASASALNDNGVGTGVSISASGSTQPQGRRRALPSALSQKTSTKEWD
jgi:hypothetical protein